MPTEYKSSGGLEWKEKDIEKYVEDGVKRFQEISGDVSTNANVLARIILTESLSSQKQELLQKVREMVEGKRKKTKSESYFEDMINCKMNELNVLELVKRTAEFRSPISYDQALDDIIKELQSEEV